MILKRSLLVALCVLAVASVTSRPAGSSPSGRRAAAPSTARPTVTQPAIAAPPATVATSTPRTVATRFAAAYARYLQGALPANRLPVLLPAARAMVVQSGPLPARLRVRQLRLTAIYGARDGWTARFAILDGRGRGEVSAELLLTHIRSRWEVAEVVAPDLETLLAGRQWGSLSAISRTPTVTPASGRCATSHPSCAACSAAIRPGCRRASAGWSPASRLTLSSHRTEWVAGANVTDGQNTHQMISVVGRVGGRWLVVALGVLGLPRTT
jgi:hypothetical protein